MKNGTANNTTGKRFSAVDAFIVVLLAAAVIGVGFRVFAGNAGLFRTSEDEYYISYVIENADSELGKAITSGTVFYIEDEKLFGTAYGDVITTPAKIYNENSKGEYVVGYSSGARIDIQGSFSVKGTMTEKGFVNDCGYLAAGMTLKVYGGGVASEILITDIVKATQ